MFIFSIKDSVDLICEAEAFEKTIAITANQGPLFVLIEIDTPGGRIDLARRICGAITKIDNCPTIAFVNGGKFGGAYSAGAMIALACDEIYIAEDTAIGAASSILHTSSGIRRARRPSRRIVPEKFILPDRPDTAVPIAYVAALAERNNRQGIIAKAMFDESISLLEVDKDLKTFFIESGNQRPSQTVVREWSKKGSLLTLTAAEAVYCKIADKIIPSLKQLQVSLDAAEARMVPNRDCEKAKRQFEKSKKTFDEILGAIPVLEKRSDELLRDLNSLERRIRDKEISIGRYKSWHRLYRRHWYKREKDVLEKMVVERQKLMRKLLSILNDLKRKYKEAVDLGKEYLDLNADVDSLVEGMNSAGARYEDVQNRPIV